MTINKVNIAAAFATVNEYADELRLFGKEVLDISEGSDTDFETETGT